MNNDNCKKIEATVDISFTLGRSAQAEADGAECISAQQLTHMGMVLLWIRSLDLKSYNNKTELQELKQVSRLDIIAISKKDGNVTSDQPKLSIVIHYDDIYGTLSDFRTRCLEVLNKCSPSINLFFMLDEPWASPHNQLRIKRTVTDSCARPTDAIRNMNDDIESGLFESYGSYLQRYDGNWKNNSSDIGKLAGRYFGALHSLITYYSVSPTTAVLRLIMLESEVTLFLKKIRSTASMEIDFWFPHDDCKATEDEYCHSAEHAERVYLDRPGYRYMDILVGSESVDVWWQTFVCSHSEAGKWD